MSLVVREVGAAANLGAPNPSAPIIQPKSRSVNPASNVPGTTTTATHPPKKPAGKCTNVFRHALNRVQEVGPTLDIKAAKQLLIELYTHPSYPAWPTSGSLVIFQYETKCHMIVNAAGHRCSTVAKTLVALRAHVKAVHLPAVLTHRAPHLRGLKLEEGRKGPLCWGGFNETLHLLRRRNREERIKIQNTAKALVMAPAGGGRLFEEWLVAGVSSKESGNALPQNRAQNDVKQGGKEEKGRAQDSRKETAHEGLPAIPIEGGGGTLTVKGSQRYEEREVKEKLT